MADPHLVEPAAVIWDEDGAPRSARFGDVYFSSADGLAETRAVFLAGCGLPEAWSGRDRFVVGELGFGSGLNIIALLDLWRRSQPAGARLHVFSVEAFLMSAEEAARALSPWPEVADLSAMLVARWPRRARGFHRIDFPDLAVSLDLAVMDVGEALTAWSGAADAWFLDGFSPAKNPAMWTPAVLQAVARRSAPDARTATFTVAGEVRRSLAAAGFAVAKAPGFGRKRERLEARLPGAEALRTPTRRIAIIGGGIAGASLAAAFARLDQPIRVYEAAGLGAGASGNPSALVMPRLDAGGGPVARLFAQAMARAHDLYGEAADAVLARGVLQQEVGPKDASRFDRIAADPIFAPGAVERLTPEAFGVRLGEPSPRGGLALHEAMVLRPDRLLDAWLRDVERHEAGITALERDGTAWRLLAADGAEIGRADVICLAAGVGCRALAPGLPLSVVRGQVGWTEGDERPAPAIGGGYVIPTEGGLLFGATHDRDDEAAEVREADTARNLGLLATLRPALAARLSAAPIQARASLRAVTPDFLPLAGAVEGPPGLFILSGLGSRGFCAAPLLAEHVAAQALGAPSPLPADLAALVEPARFARRARRSR